MEMSDQLRALATLLPGRQLPVPTIKKSETRKQFQYTQYTQKWREEKPQVITPTQIHYITKYACWNYNLNRNPRGNYRENPGKDIPPDIWNRNLGHVLSCRITFRQGIKRTRRSKTQNHDIRQVLTGK